MRLGGSFARRRGLADRVGLPILVFCWPLAFLWFYGVSANNRYLAIGNDFLVLYYDYKRQLLDQLIHFRIPLWSPSESAGFPFFASPFTQVLYPLNILLALYCRLTGGYTILDHQRFAILGVSIFTLGLYKWLRSLRLPHRAVLFAALSIGVSFKITELLRFPNAIHTAAWYPWILFALTRIFLSQSARETVKYAALLAFAAISLLTAGYLYYAYYSLFLFGPYLLVFAIPQLRARVIGLQTVKWRVALPPIAAAAVIAASVCAPYLYAVQSLLRQTTDRGGQNFVYSTEFVFNVDDTIGSLIFPPNSQAEGWYYFGALGLLITLVFLCSSSRRSASARENRTPSRIPGGMAYRTLSTKVFFLLWFGTITYITYGRDSWLFIFLWHHLPGFSSLRVWGRFNITLVPILAWLVAIGYEHMEHEISGLKGPQGQRGRLGPLAVVAIGGLVIVGTQWYLWRHRLYDSYWTLWFISTNLSLLKGSSPFAGTAIRPDQISDALAATFLMSAIGSMSVLLLLFGLSRRRPFRSPRALRLVCTGLTLLATLDLGVVGPFMWSGGIRDAVVPREPMNLRAINEASFSVPRREGVYTTVSSSSAFFVNIVPNWYFQRYVAFRRWAEPEPDALRRLLGVADGQRLFCTRVIAHASVQSFLDDADQLTGCRVVKFRYTGDTLAVAVDAADDVFVSFIDNWDKGWEAEVDDEPVPVDLLFGTFKSVKVPKGRHRLVFVYKPRLFDFLFHPFT